MPRLTAKLEREPLFTDDDPLVIDIPGVGEFRLSDVEVNPPIEDDVNPDRTPLIYLVEYLTSLAWESPEDRDAGLTPKGDELAKKLTDALRNNVVSVGELGELLGDISEAQATASRARTSRASGRPTSRRRR